jgi:hypothetical protein
MISAGGRVLRAGKMPNQGPSLGMSNDLKLIVHFSCPHCATVYTTSQQEQLAPCSGDFHCGMCGAPVHEWAGVYNFADWKPVATIPGSNGARQRL